VLNEFVPLRNDLARSRMESEGYEESIHRCRDYSNSADAQIIEAFAFPRFPQIPERSLALRRMH
jgi:hypothetical protein